MAINGRDRILLQASQALFGELDLPTVLRRIVEGAVGLVGARYGALGVIAPNGHIEQFIQVGVSDEVAARIGRLPDGHGLLGALIDDPVPIRIDRLGDDPRATGFPPHHPPMQSLLGVPVRVRGEVFGTLYLADQSSGAFSEQDQELLGGLAATAGIAIDNARLFDETKRRQRWSAASAEISAALMSERADDSLALLAGRVAALAEADLVCVALSAGPGTLSVDTASGLLAGQVDGLVFRSAGTLSGRAFDSGQPILTVDGVGSREEADSPLVLGPTMIIPLLASGRPHGVLTVSRSPGRPRFDMPDVEMASDFASQASVALGLAGGRADRQRLALLQDRSRIARDLHDNVIQRVFAAGIGLQAIGGTIDDPAIRARITDEVVMLDAAIADIRTAIFALTAQAHPGRPSIRHRIIDVLGELGALFDQPPRLVFAGPLDLATPEEMTDDLVAVVREGLCNVARHARARETIVSVAIVDGTVAVTVADDGIGIGGAERTSGIDNLAARADRWQGELLLADRAAGGTLLRWTAQVPAERPRTDAP
jgi:signal transduction histidine kinase